MNDVKILTIKDLLPVAAVDYAKGVSPISIVITGDKLDQASAVYVNDIQVSEFVILSPNRILAQVPTSERGSILRKVAVIATTPSIKRDSLLLFEVGTGINSITGIEKLVQNYCRLLLQTPGTDRFRPSEGGGLMKIVGGSVSRGDTKYIQAAVVSAVGVAKEQLTSRQNQNRRIPIDEKLLTVSTDSVGFDIETTTLIAQISLSAVSGKTAVANITL